MKLGRMKLYLKDRQLHQLLVDNVFNFNITFANPKTHFSHSNFLYFYSDKDDDINRIIVCTSRGLLRTIQIRSLIKTRQVKQ